MRSTLTEQIILAGRTAPSRVLFGPHETNLGDDRALSPRHVAYYAQRARGGAGVIVTETASVHPSDWPYERAPLAAGCGLGWRDVVEACHPHGTLVLAGLGHNGFQGSSAWSQSALWAPSRFPDPVSRELPMEMERAEIAALVDGFRAATALAVASGVDGVEIDAGASSLLRQFHSGLTNRRDDEYGADRLRLTREVIDAVRGELGDERILSLRLSCDEQAPWVGVTPQESADQVRALSDSLDLLVVVRGGPYSAASYRPDGHTEPGFNVDLCRGIRAAAAGRVPVVLQGSVVDAYLAQRALDDGVADLVEMTRAQIADPDLATRVRQGQAPRPCVLCNQACLVRDPRNPVVTCIGNPSAGHETVDPEPVCDGDLGSALVVGAGPAGLETARVLALRGFRVVLCDRRDRPGGMLRTAAAGSGRGRLANLVDWLEDECRRLGVDIRTGVEVTAADVGAAEDSVVVLATGSSPRPAPRPAPCPVGPGVQATTAAQVLAGGALEPGPVLVIDPVGGPVAVSVASWLAERGRTVSIVTPDQIVGSRLGPTGDLVGANARVQRAGITRRLASVPVSAAAGEAVLRNRFTGVSTRVPCAVLVDCAHPLPDEEIEGPDALRVGDRVAPRSVLEAVREGRLAAMSASPTRSTPSASPTRSVHEVVTG